MRKFLFVFLLVACSTNENVESLAPADFQSKIESAQDGVVLDVRTAEEVSEGVIAGAKTIDFKASDFADQIDALDKDKTYFVYCASGGRSAKAASQMKDKGFKNVYSLQGGMTAWKEQGLEVVAPQK